MYTRWYASSVKVDSLFRLLRKGETGFDVKFTNVAAWVASVVAIIGFLFALLVFGILSDSNEKNPNKKPNPNGMTTIVGMGLGLCLFGGAATWWIVASGNRLRRRRIIAFEDAIQKHNIQSCGNKLLDDDYGVPLFHSVELAECPGKRLWAWVCGYWKKDEFAWVQGGQLIDPILGKMGENDALNFGLRVLGGRHANRENRLRQAGFDAVVFSEELNLPDILLGHRQVHETGYSRAAVKEYANPLPGLPSTLTGLWGATSDVNGATGVYGALADVVNARKCLIQVINGRVVVFLNSFLGWDSDLVGSLKDVERELDFAHTVFQRLRLVAESSDPNKSTPNAELVNEVFKSHGSFRPKWGKVVGGACLSLFGGLGLLGVLNMALQQPGNAAPQKVAAMEVEANVVKRGITRGPDNPDGSKGSTARPWLSYKYTVYGEAFKTKEKLCENYIARKEAKKMALGYDEGMKITAWVDPGDPSKSALKEDQIQAFSVPTKTKNIPQGSELVPMILFGLVMLSGGLFLTVLGLIQGRHKVVVPDFETASKNPLDEVEKDIENSQTKEAAPSLVGSTSGLSSAKYFTQQTSGLLD